MFVMPAPKNVKNMPKWVWSIAGNVPKPAGNVRLPVKKWLRLLNSLDKPSFSL
jgi:hypothetical protein